AGPVNQYLEVIDVDPVSGQFYEPVDLDNRHLLAQDGLGPTEGDPRFHQQMTFAVAMKTIKAFERALGRKIFWRSDPSDPLKVPIEEGDLDEDGDGRKTYVPKLRIYPHALREPNAYYSPNKRALLFGYFRASATDPGANLPGGWVFTALSHDIIVHETTHAILDGLHPYFSESTSRDSLAFHEAMADIVALLLHFTLPEAVQGVIAAQRGNLGGRTMLSGLARQFGEATGRYSALRDAIDTDPQGQPDPTLFAKLTEPHDRGAVLVAAIFDAFVTIYDRRTADLIRLVHPNTGRGDIKEMHPDLVRRLTREACRAADHLLRMCLRALDYLPPVDITFGEFLRAIVTADTDLVPNDPMNYRLAVIQAFRRRGILPEDCLSLAPDSLLWEGPEDKEGKLSRDLIQHLAPHYSLKRYPKSKVELDLFPRYQIHRAYDQAYSNRLRTHKWLVRSSREEGSKAAREQEIEAKWETALGIFLSRESAAGLATVSRRAGDERAKQRVPVQVHSVRTTRRTGPDGQDLRQLIIEVVQKRRGFFEAGDQNRQDRLAEGGEAFEADFDFRGGATVIVDLRDGKIRYIIRKRINDVKRLEAQRQYRNRMDSETLGFTYGGPADRKGEPFALAHRGA
ncbi:hypothetical protein, partial [Allosphingosinicella sp.]|uniref:hypothetical protein n=1 Tax=Allosphingosinicella sp. TaxID=2823234 RepID=UPI002F1702F1